jgi:hypothetical protein
MSICFIMGCALVAGLWLYRSGFNLR